VSEDKALLEGWAETTLKNVLPIQYGKGLVEAHRDKDGHVPVYGSSGLVGFHNQPLTSKATLVIGRKGSVGSVYYSPVPCWPIDTTYFVEENDSVNLKFFLHLLLFLRLGQFDKSTAVPGLSRDDYNAVTVKIAPLPEQHRIVSAIEQQFSRLDAGVAALQRAKAKLKRYRAAVLKAAVEGKLTETWRAEHPTTEPASQLLERILKERRAKWEADLGAKGKDPVKVKYVEPVAADIENLPGLPRGWCWVSVEQIGRVQLGRQRAPQHHNGKFMRPYLRVANVFEDYIDTSDVMTMNFTPEEYETYRLKYGDILLNEGQSLELIGRPAIYRDEVPGACFQNTLVRFSAYSSLMPEYALTVFRVYLHTQKFQHIGKHTTNIAHLGAGRFAILEFPLPSLAEQKQIVAEVERYLSLISQLEVTVDANLKRSERLRQSILREAFAGRLVPQEPTDEPASVLLERIRNERNNQKNNIEASNKKSRSIKLPESVAIDVVDAEQVELWESVGN